jgi:hypothetical protein
VNLDGILSRARSKAERLMVDTCTIRRPGSVVTDPVSGVVSPTYETVYQGKCKVQTFTNRELLHTGGDYQFIIQRYEVQIPVSVVGVKVNDQAVITASVHDPDLAGRTYRVVGLMDKSEGSARRLGVEEMA